MQQAEVVEKENVSRPKFDEQLVPLVLYDGRQALHCVIVDAHQLLRDGVQRCAVVRIVANPHQLLGHWIHAQHRIQALQVRGC